MTSTTVTTYADRLREIGMFFDGTDAVHQTMRHVATHLDDAGIAYCIVGGMAVNAHRYHRTTGDVDFLLTADGFREFASRLETTGFERIENHARKFRDPATGVTFDILVTGLFPGSGRPGPIAFPDPAAVAERVEDLNVVDLPTLVELKLAARRFKDFGDVVDLIRQNGLDESFQNRLHESVRADFIECLAEMRREDDYERRQDRAVEEIES